MVGAPRCLNKPDKSDDSDKMTLSPHYTTVSHGIPNKPPISDYSTVTFVEQPNSTLTLWIPVKINDLTK